MRQSRVEGIILIYVAMQAITMFLQSSTTGDANVWSPLQHMWYLNLTQQASSSISFIWIPAATVLSVFAAFLSAILLYYPAIFYGLYIWFWWIICLPIAIGFIISIITVIRGVQTT